MKNVILLLGNGGANEDLNSQFCMQFWYFICQQTAGQRAARFTFYIRLVTLRGAGELTKEAPLPSGERERETDRERERDRLDYKNAILIPTRKKRQPQLHAKRRRLKTHS